MASDFFKTILEREIGSKLNLMLAKEGVYDSYVALLQGKGFDFNIDVNLESDEPNPKLEERMADMIFQGVEDLVDRQIEEFDFFSIGKEEPFSYRIEKRVKTKKQGISGNMRLKSGRFANPLQLTNLINMILPQMVTKFMSEPGSVPDRRKPLVYRTGRLAHSGFVTNMIANSNTVKTLYFTYQTRPYSVFDPRSGSSMASEARDPKKLFARAIDAALGKLLNVDTFISNKFNIMLGNYRVGTITRGVLNER